MKITIGKRPKRSVMIFYVFQALFLGLLIVLGTEYLYPLEILDKEMTSVASWIVYIVSSTLLALITVVHYLSALKYWETDDEHIQFILPGMRLSLIKQIPMAYFQGKLKPTIGISLEDLGAVTVDVRKHYYMNLPQKELHIHLIFCLKDGSTISMFAGDGHYHEEMIQIIQLLKEKNIQLIDPYHLLDDPTQLYEKIGVLSC